MAESAGVWKQNKTIHGSGPSGMLFSIAPRNEPGYCSRRPNGSVCFPDGLHELFHVHCSTDADEGRVHQDRSAVLDVTLSQTKRFVSCSIARIPARSTSKTIGPQTAHHSIYGTTCQARMHGRGDEKRGLFFRTMFFCCRHRRFMSCFGCCDLPVMLPKFNLAEHLAVGAHQATRLCGPR